MTYPTDLDSFTPVVDNVDDIMAEDINELQTALASLEVKLGVDGSAVITSIDYLLKNSASIDPGHRHSKLYQSDNGDVAITVDANGNVGIGTTAPGAKLQVKGNVKVLTESAGTGGAYLLGRTATDGQLAVSAGANQYATGSVAGDLILRTEATSQALILNSGAGAATLVVKNGNVGIGTTAPSTKLHVDGTGIITSDLRVGTTSAGNARLSVRGAGTSSSTYSIEAANSAGGTRFIVRDDGRSSFYGSDNAEKVTITETGNVGIGTTTPSNSLHVHSSDNDILRISNTDADDNPAIIIQNDATLYRLTVRGSDSDTFNIRTQAGVNALSVDSSGNVGIGTTVPNSTLHVAGEIEINKAFGTGSALVTQMTFGNVTFGANSTHFCLVGKSEVCVPT